MCHDFTYLHLLVFYVLRVNFQSVSKYSVGTMYAMFYLSTLCYNFSRCFFAATMSMKHFQLISAFLEFDVRKTREEHWKHDKFSCMKYIFDKVNCKLPRVKTQAHYQQLMKCCIRTKDIYLSSNKTRQNLAKHGLLQDSLCDASVPCTYCSLPYAGKPNLIDDKANYAKYLLNGLQYRFNKIKGCNIWMDWYFKLYVPSAKWASENDFRTVGKMRLDHICLPNEIKTMEGREEKSTQYLYKKKW